MKVIVALGNPGHEYALTRHNAGWMAMDRLVAQEKLMGKKSAKMQAEIFDLKLGRNKALLAKPMTFMNESGKTVRALINFYRFLEKDLIVVHDDKDIPVGEIRVQSGRGAAGHNGIKSIIETLGTKDFTRVRIGVGPVEKEKIEIISDFVLNKFTKEEFKILQPALDNAIAEIKRLALME